MKKILSIAAALVLSVAVKAQVSDVAVPAAQQIKAEDVAKFNVEKHDFGKVIVGTPVTYSFEIKNISNKPLVVVNSWASCGCTTPEKIEEPIMPGQTAKLKVQYNAAAVGPINKDVYVQFADVPQPKTVHITGEVLSAEAFDVYTKEQEKIKAEEAAKAKNKSKATKTKANN